MEVGRSAEDIGRQCGVSKHTVYAWKAKYGGLEVREAQELKRLREENSFAKQQSPCATCYLSYDHLGSVRMIPDSAANIISRHDYLPFGEEIPANTAGRRSEWGPFGDKVNQKFTGQERDDETGFDFFQARYFYGAQGRFNSPDPGNAGADLYNPQSWNGYSYVLNNPLSAIDPAGTCSIKDGDTEATDDPGEPCVAPGDTSTTVNGGPPGGVPPDNSAPENPLVLDQTPTFFDIAYLQPLAPGQLQGQAKNGKPCGGTGFGFGFAGSANADGAVIAAGASATGSLGAGLFHGSNTGWSGGAFASGGAVAFAGSHIAGARPKRDRMCLGLVCSAE